MRSPCFSFRHVLAVALLLAIAPSASAKLAHSGVTSRQIGADVGDQAIAEAASRFALPELWVRAVIRAKSFVTDRQPRRVLGARFRGAVIKARVVRHRP